MTLAVALNRTSQFQALNPALGSLKPAAGALQSGGGEVSVGLDHQCNLLPITNGLLGSQFWSTLWLQPLDFGG